MEVIIINYITLIIKHHEPELNTNHVGRKTIGLEQPLNVSDVLRTTNVLSSDKELKIELITRIVLHIKEMFTCLCV